MFQSSFFGGCLFQFCFHPRVSSPSLCDPSHCGVLHEPRLCLLHRRVRPRALPPSRCSLAGWHPGSGWKAVTHSLQSAEALRTRTRPGPHRTGAYEPGPAAPGPASVSADPATVCPAPGPGHGPAAAVSYQACTASTAREEPPSPSWDAAGKWSIVVEWLP